ncbi:efflux RND transporter periplasmic adaptor subunit [Methylobacterium iners]|uniref:Peptidase M50 n=1 Tax=Methylobacterium iners TaxID=418707 RepID=A0ABQ4RVN2_9HYPH|nr:HlyD family efflux transporter periplasmic adaptor subunit [Methylobacterium iners]GJD94846.1 hypothetical protein OCOJLMKI_2052 [Methylobacterium iners]
MTGIPFLPGPGAAAIGPQPLPPLREDLRLVAGAPSSTGEPTWLIYDPLGHRYHELTDTGLAVLKAWRPGETAEALQAAASAALGQPVSREDVNLVVKFADETGLVVEPNGGWQALARRLERGRQGWAGWLLHNYLFIRIPLLQPQSFLESTLPAARRLAGPTALWVVAVAGLLGLYLVSREWDAFSSTFLHFLSPEGMAGYLLALLVVKVLHELGHAYTAVHHGARVPTMGVALMVLMPVLYTDTTDSWRLRDRRARLAIDGAGIAVELAVAAFATLAWALLPEGTLRSAAFFMATAGWTVSLAVNLNPFMRFDGYYIACDLTGISNLQPRAFALSRWALRETLFGLGDPCPEIWDRRTRQLVVAYGFAVWLYRLVLFTGIAVMVYAVTFKVLGLLLFVVEIGWFVVKPVWTELVFWWRNRGRVRLTTRSACVLGGLLVLAVALVAPISRHVEFAAVIEPARSEHLTAHAPARIVALAVRPGDRVEAGQVLARLEAPLLEQEVARARAHLALVELKWARRAADAADRQSSQILDRERHALREKLGGLDRQRQDLVLAAPFGGIVATLASDLHENRWVGRGEDLGTLVSEGQVQVRGLLPEAALSRLKAGAAGRFTPDDLLTPSLPVQLASISEAAVAAVEIPYLASTHGGGVAVREDKSLGAVPVEAHYTLLLQPTSGPVPHGVLRGTVTLEGRADSFLGRVLRRAIAVLVRESGV